MAVPTSGRGAAIGIGVESTWGTAVARSNWLKVVSTTIARSVISGDVAHLCQGAAGDRRDRFQESIEAGGNVVVQGRYDAIGMLLDAWLGSSSTSGTGSPYTHTYAMTAALPSLTIEVIRGNATNSEVFEGMKVSSGTLEIAANGIATLSLDFIGQTSAARASAGTPTFTDAEFIKHHHAWTATHGSLVAGTRSLSISLNNQLARIPELGASETTEPEISAPRAAEVVLVRSYRDDVQYTAHLAETQQDLVINSTGATSPNALQITARNAIATVISGDVSDFGVLTETVTFSAYADSVDPSFEFALINATATATAN
jgi:hypothetical protein